ncbi:MULTISPECIES: ribonuclease E inhibitor RraB [unclassified Pseudoalteromonas]|uniref:ribonuclease E inhibitor RraB n=2 Tax=Pseudoalteromonas TaxID=53246 RepID=UPI0015FC687A|nr:MULTISPECIES: ribonuclease E inhibitor RraB [unclassified Pseudoalteromonas]MBB1414443.1 ribonuclease E inhibitor RraB [Pseudoalteromonas sp. SG43-8]
MMEEFPNDDDGRTLKELAQYGIKKGSKIDIELYCYAKNLNTAKSICDEKFISDNYETDIFENEEAVSSLERISVYFKRNVILNYENVINEQLELNRILSEFGTKCDGWGALIDSPQ